MLASFQCTYTICHLCARHHSCALFIQFINLSFLSPQLCYNNLYIIFHTFITRVYHCCQFNTMHYALLELSWIRYKCIKRTIYNNCKNCTMALYDAQFSMGISQGNTLNASHIRKDYSNRSKHTWQYPLSELSQTNKSCLCKLQWV